MGNNTGNSMGKSNAASSSTAATSHAPQQDRLIQLRLASAAAASLGGQATIIDTEPTSTNMANPAAASHAAQRATVASASAVATMTIDLAQAAQSYAEQIAARASQGTIVINSQQLPVGLIAHMAVRTLTLNRENAPSSMDRWVNALL